MNFKIISIATVFSLSTLTSALLISSCATHKRGTTEVAALGLKNTHQPTASIITSGQPTKEQISALAKQGVKHVVNFRPHSEQDFAEASYVRELGMNYINIPVSGASDLTVENAKKLDEALAEIGSEPALLHCGSGNRVGAIMAIRECKIKGTSNTQAIATGKSWGLTSLEPAVKERLK